MTKRSKKDQVTAENMAAADTAIMAEEEEAVPVPVEETAPVEESAAAAGETNQEETVETAVEGAADLAAQLEQARQEAANNLAGWQRSAAEMANFKRRQEEQLKLQRDMIKADVLQGVISALDDMDLAFQNVPEKIDGQLIGWVEGFRLVQRKLDKVLEDQHVAPINTQGQFDPNLHEAISYEESQDHQDGEIIAELRKGYQIGNRVIRPALVRVAKRVE